VGRLDRERGGLGFSGAGDAGDLPGKRAAGGLPPGRTPADRFPYTTALEASTISAAPTGPNVEPSAPMPPRWDSGWGGALWVRQCPLGGGNLGPGEGGVKKCYAQIRISAVQHAAACFLVLVPCIFRRQGYRPCIR